MFSEPEIKLFWPVKGIGLIPGIGISQEFGNPGIVGVDTKYGDKLVKAGQSLYSLFGMKGHNGIDISCPEETEVFAAHKGSLQFYIDKNGYGNYAVITNGKGGTVYGHLKFFEGKDRLVEEGEKIAYSGNTGLSTGPHLHFARWLYATSRDNGFLGYTDPWPEMKIRAILTGYRNHPEKFLPLRLDSMDRLAWIFEKFPALSEIYQLEREEYTMPLNRPPFPIP